MGCSLAGLTFSTGAFVASAVVFTGTVAAGCSVTAGATAGLLQPVPLSDIPMAASAANNVFEYLLTVCSFRFTLTVVVECSRYTVFIIERGRSRVNSNVLHVLLNCDQIATVFIKCRPLQEDGLGQTDCLVCLHVRFMHCSAAITSKAATGTTLSGILCAAPRLTMTSSPLP